MRNVNDEDWRSAYARAQLQLFERVKEQMHPPEPERPIRGVMSQRDKIRLIKQRAKQQQKKPSAFRKFLARLGGHRG